ncbi:MAG TPA: LamG domain-containing protein, partial [Candidatus Thermoplasmatota archaeon]|nr:LamG domain-containing protein [Candidatus Thermoplasmatota archaeon]
TVIFMYYGNPTCINQQYPEKTWNSRYKAVWHLNNNPIGAILDSTINNNDGTSHGSMTLSNLVDGKTGKCLEFDGINDYISVSDSSSLKPTDLTLVTWFRPQAQNPTEGNFVAKHCYDFWGNAAGHTYALCMRPGNLIAGGIETDTYEQAVYLGLSPLTLNTWFYLTLTFDESTNTGRFYVNGVLQETKVVDSSALWYNNPWDFTMGGCRWSSGNEQVINTFFNCRLDEIKILNTLLSPGWISTEYANQNNPSGFLSFGPEEQGP